MDSSLEIEEQAGAWLAKRDGGEWSAQEQRHFAQWLERSVAHRVAFLRLEEMWDRTLRLQALSAGTTPGTVPSPHEWHRSPFFDERRPLSEFEPTSAAADIATDTESDPSASNNPRRVRSRLALAASILLAITLMAAVVSHIGSREPSFSTPVGGVASVPVSDGSRITLNTDSQVRLMLTKAERRVELEHGEAFFEVAKDPIRPFVVVAGTKRIIAVGTQFSVRRVEDQVSVFVSDGRVRVEDEGKARSADPKVLVSAGGIVQTNKRGIVMQENAGAQVEDYLSWRSGYLVFREIPLSRAVAEFNRYNEQKVTIQDPAVGSLRVSGKIRATNFDAFTRLLEDGFAVQVQHADGRIVLTEKK